MNANFFQNVIYPFYETHLRQRKTLVYYRELERSQWLSPKELEHNQQEALGKLLRHAYTHVPYYRDMFHALGILPEDIRTPEDFRRLPHLTKDIIRENFDRLVAVNFKDKLIAKATGGSTGVPLNFAHDHDSYQWRMAAARRGYTWAGCQDGQSTIYIWGAPITVQSKFRRIKESLHQRMLGRKVFNSFHFDAAAMNACFKYINRARPQGMVGYTSAVYHLAEFIKKSGRACVKIPAIITAAEKVFPHQRVLIEEVFGGKVFNSYGSREFMLIGMECEKHEGLHLNIENLVVEILKDGEPVGPGETGEVVVTDLHNYGFPFIRYSLGDLAIAGTRACGCGRGLPLIKDVEGRLLDVIRTQKGTIVPGEFFPHLMKEFNEVHQFQVIQKELNSLELKMVCREPLDSERTRFLNGALIKVFGDELRIDIQYVDFIPLTASGKFRVTISEVT